jgi:hypothetical protein
MMSQIDGGYYLLLFFFSSGSCVVVASLYQMSSAAAAGPSVEIGAALMESPRRDPHFGTLNLAVLGCPSSLGQPKKGVEEGPKAIREAGILESLGSALRLGSPSRSPRFLVSFVYIYVLHSFYLGLGWSVTDNGDLDVDVVLPDDEPMGPEGARRPRSCGRANHMIFESVYASRAAGKCVSFARLRLRILALIVSACIAFACRLVVTTALRSAPLAVF